MCYNINMKAKTFLLAASVWTALLCAAADVSAWDASPIGWRTDAATSVAAAGTSPFATRDMARTRVGDFHVRVTPEGARTNNWATLGLALRDDDRNFWHVALVRTPPEKGEHHTFELCEMRNGQWLAQSEDGLACTQRRQTGAWSYGETYDVSLSVTTEGIRGEVKDLSGKSLFCCAFAFPKPAADGTVRAVTAGRLALHSTGAFRGRFDAVQAVVAQEAPAVPSPVYPPYASDSFVADVTDAATGYFHMARKDGRWWAIDPLGRGTVLLGVDHVTYWGHASQRTGKAHHLEAMKKKFPNKADWEADTLGRLKAWGFNLLGAGCDEALKHHGLVHTIFLSIGDGFCWDGMDPDYFICPNEHRPCSAFPNVFHPDFPAWADYKARQACAPNRTDPWLFGYFIDNELAWWGRGRQDTGLFEAVEKLPEAHSAKKALRDFLAARGVTGAASDADKLDFLKLAADRYFRIASEAIRRHDPNHLVMGARFAGLGGAHPAVWEASGRFCDVVTFNCYPWADLDRNVMFTDRGLQAKRITDAFTEQYGYVKKPMLITEWSFPALDSGLPCTGGAGQRFQTQAQRTQATELFAKTMLSLPFLIGYDYFMWVDEPPEGISDAFPEDSNYGLINEQGEAYPEITSMFTRLHKTVGTWRRASVPAERPAAARSGLRAADVLARVPAGGAPATVVKTDGGNGFKITTAAGLELVGRKGGANFFDAVRLNGRDLGRYTAMLNDKIGGSLRWRDIARVSDVDIQELDGRVVLTITGEQPKGPQAFALTHRVTVFNDKPWFLCELVAAKNLGTEPIDVNAFYFRQYAPYAPDKASLPAAPTVPNLWKAPSCDAWFAKDGVFFGGWTCAPTVTMFGYHLMNNNTSQHPDAMFAPEYELLLKPGETYVPKGTIWMLAAGGCDGVAGWRRMVEQFPARN